MTSVLWVLALLLVVAGIAGVIVPAVPGTTLVFLGLFVAAGIDGFQKVGWLTILVLGFFTFLSYAVDFLASYFGAKKVGASKWSLLGASAGMLIGLFFGLAGLLIGPFLGAVIAELIVKQNLPQAGKAGLGAWLGMLFGTMIKMALVFTMIGVFVIAFLL